MFKPSRRAAVIAASFALGLSCVGPYAHAGLLGDDSQSSSVEGLPLPVGGDLLGDGLLGEDGVLGLLGGGLLGGDLLGEDGVLGLLGGDLLGSLPVGGLPVDGLLAGGLPVVDEVLAGGGSVLAGDGVVGVLEPVAEVAGVVPGAVSVFEVLNAFSDSGSLVPGLQVLDEIGLLGLLSL